MSGRAESPGRALALFAALFAVTLNFLQPLLHAALVRDGAPATLWSVFCKTAPEQRQEGQRKDAPVAADKHECCLGLAHATAFPMPSAVAIATERPATTVRPLRMLEVATSVGIRDGPHRPRGPPLLA